MVLALVVRASAVWCAASRLRSAQSDDDDGARSQFGTKDYWDEMYAGRGDFSSEEYSWYFGWDKIRPIWEAHVPDKASRVLLPGAGNDPTVASLHAAGWRDLTAFDYSAEAVARLEDLLWDADPPPSVSVADARDLHGLADASFDAALEKGALDAIYLAGDGNLERAVDELSRVIRRGGVLVSVSGVVPPELRRRCFDDARWAWLRDGGDDLAAGSFVLERR